MIHFQSEEIRHYVMHQKTTCQKCFINMSKFGTLSAEYFRFRVSVLHQTDFFYEIIIPAHKQVKRVSLLKKVFSATT